MSIDVSEERENITKFDPEEKEYCEILLKEIERLQMNLSTWKNMTVQELVDMIAGM